MRLGVEHGKQVGLRERHGIYGAGSGSVLVVDQTKQRLEGQEVRSMYKLIGDMVVPLMAEETLKSWYGEWMRDDFGREFAKVKDLLDGSAEECYLGGGKAMQA
jgi:hypothetical protein